MTKRSSNLRRDNLGFLLAKAVQRWNDMLRDGFTREDFPQVRPSFGSVLIPLFEEDGMRIGELARRSRLSKQTMTTMVRAVEAARLVELRADSDDGRASRVWLTAEARQFQPVVVPRGGRLVFVQYRQRRRLVLADRLVQVMGQMKEGLRAVGRIGIANKRLDLLTVRRRPVYRH